jgi:DNA-binding NarL/FixJ family response regulator
VLAPVGSDQLHPKTTLTDTGYNWANNVLRVLIVENQLLLGAGLQSLLIDETDLDVIGTSPSDQPELVEQIKRIRPDVVLLDVDSRLTDPADLLTCLENYPKLRVLVVSSDDHLIRIYDKQEVLIRGASQLANLLSELAKQIS